MKLNDKQKNLLDFAEKAFAIHGIKCRIILEEERCPTCGFVLNPPGVQEQRELEAKED